MSMQKWFMLRVGPAVTRFELAPEMGVKVSKITSLTDDIKLSLAAKDIRIEAPIPGKHTIGIEVPNRKSRPVFLREIIDQPAFLKAGIASNSWTWLRYYWKTDYD